MRQLHDAGDKLFVGLSPTPARNCISRGPRTGEVVEVELFVAVLGCVELRVRDRPRFSEAANCLAGSNQLVTKAMRTSCV
jgi:hypothetical protein